MSARTCTGFLFVISRLLPQTILIIQQQSLEDALRQMSTMTHHFSSHHELEQHTQIMRCLEDYSRHHELCREIIHTGARVERKKNMLSAEKEQTPHGTRARRALRRQIRALRLELEILRNKVLQHRTKALECEARLEALGVSGQDLGVNSTLVGYLW
jgi:hypothetical protein